MMKRIVGWFVLVPLCALLVLFALANRQTIMVGLSPFGEQSRFLPSFEIPLFVLIYGMLLIGVVLGGLASWLAQGRNRRERRQFKRESAQLTKELDETRRMARKGQPRQGVLGPDDFLEDD